MRRTYESLNPAKLKKAIDAKIAQLYRAYKKKSNGPRKVEASRITSKKLVPSMVSFLIGQPV